MTKLHIQSGVAEKFIEDVKSCVKAIMSQENPQLGKIVIQSLFFVSLLLFFTFEKILGGNLL